MKNEPGESSPELQVNFLTTRWSRREFREAMYMSQMLSSAFRIMIGLSEVTGKPAVFIWNEKSKQCVLLTHSSLGTLLFKLLLGGQESLSSEESVSSLRMIFGLDELSWRRFTQHMFSETLDSKGSFLRTSADSLVQSKASSVPSEYVRQALTQSLDSESSGESSSQPRSSPTTLRVPTSPGTTAGTSSASDSRRMASVRSWFRSIIPSRRSKRGG